MMALLKCPEELWVYLFVLLVIIGLALYGMNLREDLSAQANNF